MNLPDLDYRRHVRDADSSPSISIASHTLEFVGTFIYPKSIIANTLRLSEVDDRPVSLTHCLTAVKQLKQDIQADQQISPEVPQPCILHIL